MALLDMASLLESEVWKWYHGLYRYFGRVFFYVYCAFFLITFFSFAYVG